METTLKGSQRHAGCGSGTLAGCLESKPGSGGVTRRPGSTPGYLLATLRVGKTTAAAGAHRPDAIVGRVAGDARAGQFQV